MTTADTVPPEVAFMRRWNESASAKKIPPCQICGDTGATVRMVKDGTPLYQCSKCSLQFTSISGHDSLVLAEMYKENFFEGNDAGCRAMAYVSYEKKRNAVIRSVRERLKLVTGFTRRGDLLELGCAMGFGLEAARMEGFTPVGYEISEWAAGYAREKLGLEVVTGRLEELAESRAGRFNVIAGFDILTHMTKPAHDLDLVNRLLAPGGALLIEEGINDSPAAKIMGKNWVHYAFPFHVHFFSRKNLYDILERHGFEVMEAAYLPKYEQLDEFVAHITRFLLPGPLKGIGNLLCKITPDWFVKYNSYYNLTLSARKVREV